MATHCLWRAATARWEPLCWQHVLARYDAIAVGPGLGTNCTEALDTLLSSACGKPLVLDADALNMLVNITEKESRLGIQGHLAPTILTPHAKEFERLFGTYKSPEERQDAQRMISRQSGCAIVYKGNRTQTTGSKGEMYINTTGNPGMATAGSGDVLTGVLLAILAQNKERQLDAAMCASLGVWIHGKSGDLAHKKLSECGIVASDIIDFLPKATI